MDDDIERIQLLIVDESHSDTSKSLIADLQKRPELLVTTSPARDIALQTLRRGDATQVLLIGAKFEALTDARRKLTFLVQLVATVAARCRIQFDDNLPRLLSDEPVACNFWLLITARGFGLGERDLIRHA